MTTRAYLDVRKARKLIAELKPDVVHGQEIGLNSDIAARCSLQLRGDRTRDHLRRGHLYHRASLRNTLRAKLIHDVARASLRRAGCHLDLRYDARELSGMTGERVSIANPTAAEFFALAPSAPTGPRLLFAGGLIPLKNPPQAGPNAFAGGAPWVS